MTAFWLAAIRHADKLRAPSATVSFIGLLGGVHVDDLATGRGPRNLLPTRAQAVNVEFDGLPDQRQGFLASVRSGDASRKIGDIDAKRRLPFLDYNEYRILDSYFLNPACFRTLLRVPGFSRDRDGSGLGLMLKLTMTAFGPNQDQPSDSIGTR